MGGLHLAQFSLGLAAVSGIVLLCSISGRGGFSRERVELVSVRRNDDGGSRLNEAPSRGRSVRDLIAVPLEIHRGIDRSDASYAAGFPHSYFAASPNPNSRYSWTCPGPSVLDDPHSGACPLLASGFRCCLDTENGAAVADDMCCPKRESELRPRAVHKSRRQVERTLDDVLLKIVEKLERQQYHPVPQDPDYISAAQANDDIARYFDGLSAKPHKIRSMKTSQAQQDLQDFFKVLSKGDIAGLLPRPPPPAPIVVPQAGDKRAVKNVAETLANQVVQRDESDTVREQKENYEDWRKRSMAGSQERAGDDVLKGIVKEERKDRGWAEEEGRESAQQWNSFHQPYFTDVPGSKPARLGEIDVPDGDVHIQTVQ